MNRREFCQTTALFLAGSSCAGASLRPGERTTRFRVQKVFFESLGAEKTMREKLGVLSRNGSHAVLLIHGGRNVSSVEVKKIESAACRFNLKLLVPARLSHDLLDKTRAVLPLSHEAGILQNINGKPADNGGLLLLDKAGELHGLVLYDSSQYLWTSFAAPHVDSIKNSCDGESGARLMIARWLDDALFALSCSNEKSLVAYECPSSPIIVDRVF